MKFHELKPFILEAVYALFLYIACPLFMLLNGWIEIQIADFVGFILIIIWSACFLKTSLDKGTQRKTTENELPSLTQCTA